MRAFIRTEVTCRTSEVLERLLANREQHSVIVKEARTGYLVQAQEALKEKIAELESGKLATLTFTLAPPRNYTRVYDTAISMLQAHTEETIVLDSDEFRSMMLDKWDWAGDFVTTNARYSSTADKLSKDLMED